MKISSHRRRKNRKVFHCQHVVNTISTILTNILGILRDGRLNHFKVINRRRTLRDTLKILTKHLRNNNRATNIKNRRLVFTINNTNVINFQSVHRQMIMKVILGTIRINFRGRLIIRLSFMLGLRRLMRVKTTNNNVNMRRRITTVITIVVRPLARLISFHDKMVNDKNESSNRNNLVVRNDKTNSVRLFGSMTIRLMRLLRTLRYVKVLLITSRRLSNLLITTLRDVSDKNRRFFRLKLRGMVTNIFVNLSDMSIFSVTRLVLITTSRRSIMFLRNMPLLMNDGDNQLLNNVGMFSFRLVVQRISMLPRHVVGLVRRHVRLYCTTKNY